MKICRNKCTKYTIFKNGRATYLDDFTWNDPNRFYGQTKYYDDRCNILMWSIEMHVFVSNLVHERSLLRKGCTVELYCMINYLIIALFSIVSEILYVVCHERICMFYIL
jgi:hypothetical protein